MTANLFSLYLMINFMFHTMLDAMGNILRAYYKSMKCDVLFSRGSMSTLFRCGEHVFHVGVNCSFCLQQCKNYKNQMSFSRVMITNVLPCFFYESQCICFCFHVCNYFAMFSASVNFYLYSSLLLVFILVSDTM